MSNTKTFGSNTVNEAQFGYIRLNNYLGVPKGGVGVTLADQGISSSPEGIQQGFPKYAGVEALYFSDLVGPEAVTSRERHWLNSIQFIRTGKVRGNCDSAWITTYSDTNGSGIVRDHTPRILLAESLLTSHASNTLSPSLPRNSSL
jgi:hypothetical protein